MISTRKIIEAVHIHLRDAAANTLHLGQQASHKAKKIASRAGVIAKASKSATRSKQTACQKIVSGSRRSGSSWYRDGLAKCFDMQMRFLF